jgi:hypothetical protein
LPDQDSGVAEKLGACAQHSGAALKDEALYPIHVKQHGAAWSLQKARLGDLARLPREPRAQGRTNVRNGIFSAHSP